MTVRLHRLGMTTLTASLATQPRRVHAVAQTVLRPNIRTQPQKVHAVHIDVLRKTSVVESLLYGTTIHRLVPRASGTAAWLPVYSLI